MRGGQVVSGQAANCLDDVGAWRDASSLDASMVRALANGSWGRALRQSHGMSQALCSRVGELADKPVRHIYESV